MIQPLAWTKTFLRFPDGNALNLLLYLWAIVIVAILEEDVSEGNELYGTTIQLLLDVFGIYKHFLVLSYVEFFELIEILAFLILDKEKTAHPKTFNHTILLVFLPATIMSNHSLLTVRVKTFFSIRYFFFFQLPQLTYQMMLLLIESNAILEHFLEKHKTLLICSQTSRFLFIIGHCEMRAYH